MIEGVPTAAIEAGIIEERVFDEGIGELHRAAEPDGVFCDTFFKAVGTQGMRVAGLDEIYRLVEEAAERFRRLHGRRLTCRRGCCRCCVDDLTVFEVEAWHIQNRFGELLEAGEPHPVGSCAFLGSGGDCRIYEARPYVCRTQGWPLRWMEEDAEGDWFEMRDICPLNDSDPPVEELAEDLCWTIGPVEGRLAGLQASIDGGLLRRVPLRSLFRKGVEPEAEASSPNS